MKHVHRKTERTPEEAAKLRAVRERYQREKPTPEQLLAEGATFVPLGELLRREGSMKPNRFILVGFFGGMALWCLPMAWVHGQWGWGLFGFCAMTAAALIARKHPDYFN